MTLAPFDLAGPLPARRMLVEASAGTGKTYSIAALVARFVAGDVVTHGSVSGQRHDLTEGIGVDELLVVTYTRAAAGELRDRIRAKLRLAAEYLAGAPAPSGEEWLTAFDVGTARQRQRQLVRLNDALARFDEATITTIHGFCQQALAQYGLRSGGGAAELIEDLDELVIEVCRDLLVDRLAVDPLAMSPDGKGRPVDPTKVGVADRQPISPAQVERYVAAAVRAVLTNLGARSEPAAGAGGLAGAWSATVAAAVAEVAARQRDRRQIGYDRLITDLDALLADPVRGAELADQLAQRYRLVLVDEFQDTDRLQWDIFDRAFAKHRLITVGDPKQAIYRFRGADVHAYLAAAGSAGTDLATLRTNHRSDRRLLDAVAVLFDGVSLGHPDIEFARVDAAPMSPLDALGDRAALHLRVVPDDPAIPHNSVGLATGAVVRIVLSDVASRIRDLLDTATIRVGKRKRRVQPSDIGVLVPSQRRATEAAAVLREWGIPTVRARTGSVLSTPAATQWRLLLAGLATPTRSAVARGAGLSWFFDLRPADLVDAPAGTVGTDGAEPALAVLQRRLAVLGARLRAGGVGAFYEHLRAESALLPTVLGRPTGERDLTDLDHLAELLTAELGGTLAEPARVAEVFERLVANADDLGEVAMRRIETDDEAVRITTVHAAKGLEYPIVLVPFAWTERSSTGRPYVYNVGGRRVVDVASWVAWGDGVAEGSREALAAQGERRRLASVEIDGDGLRLLYVALTRAKHRLEVWWAPTKKAPTSALGRLLLDRWGAGPVFNSPIGDKYEQADAERADAQIDAIVAAANGTIARAGVPIEQPVRHPLPLGAQPPRLLTVADGASRHPLADPARGLWSFTAIASRLDPHVDATPVAGGLDEPAGDADGQVPQLPPELPAASLLSAPAGTTFGLAVHEVLEHADFASPALLDDITALVASAGRRSGLVLDAPAIAAGLVAAIDTPLGPLFDGVPLRRLATNDRLAELSFDVSLEGPAVNAARIGEALAATLDAGDPLRGYGADLAAELGDVDVAGWLTGSIDAVFRVGGPGVDARFVIVDYKSNRLHRRDDADPLAAYRPDRLVTAMTHSNYPLQAILYAVALHRYLRWRLGVAYDPARHLGGVAYLFVRGMTGPEAPTFGDDTSGVFSWTPPAAAVLAVDEILTGGAA